MYNWVPSPHFWAQTHPKRLIISYSLGLSNFSFWRKSGPGAAVVNPPAQNALAAMLVASDDEAAATAVLAARPQRQPPGEVQHLR